MLFRSVTRVVVRVDEFEILCWPDGEAEAFEPRVDYLGPADQDGNGGFFFDPYLRRPQHAPVLALGIKHPSRGGSGLGIGKAAGGGKGWDSGGGGAI